MKSSSDLILSVLGEVRNQIDSADTEENSSSIPKSDFKKNIDIAFQVATTLFSVAASATSVCCPPASIALAGIAVMMSALHLYDKNNNYDFSQWMMDKINILSLSTQDISSRFTLFSRDMLTSPALMALPQVNALRNG